VERKWALKMLDEVRRQLSNIHVATKDNGEWDLTRNGAYRFSATGKKDLASAALFSESDSIGARSDDMPKWKKPIRVNLESGKKPAIGCRQSCRSGRALPAGRESQPCDRSGARAGGSTAAPLLVLPRCQTSILPAIILAEIRQSAFINS